MSAPKPWEKERASRRDTARQKHLAGETVTLDEIRNARTTEREPCEYCRDVRARSVPTADGCTCGRMLPWDEAKARILGPAEPLTGPRAVDLLKDGCVSAEEVTARMRRIQGADARTEREVRLERAVKLALPELEAYARSDRDGQPLIATVEAIEAIREALRETP